MDFNLSQHSDPNTFFTMKFSRGDSVGGFLFSLSVLMFYRLLFLFIWRSTKKGFDPHAQKCPKITSPEVRLEL